MTGLNTHDFPNVGALISFHAECLDANPYSFFELTCCGRRGWRVAVAARTCNTDPSGGASMLARGIASGVEDASRLALQSIADKPAWLSDFLDGTRNDPCCFPGLGLMIDRYGELVSLSAEKRGYLEIAYSRTTDWVGWLCTDDLDVNPDRKIVAHAGGRDFNAAAWNTAQHPSVIGGLVHA